MNRKSHRKIELVSKRKFHIFKELLPLYPAESERGQRLHLILTKAVQKSRHYLAEGRQDPYIYFSYKEATLLGTRKYKEKFKILVDLGLLKPVLHYNRHNKKQELLTFEPVILQPLRHGVSVSHSRIENSLESYYRSRKRNLSSVVNRHLLPVLRKIQIDITEEEYRKAVSDNYLTYVKEFHDDYSNSRKQMLTYSAYVENSKHLYLKIKDFNSAHTDEIYSFISQDSFSGRVHTPITILPKFLKNRGIIKYKGESMTELDLQTFQPLLLADILDGTDFAQWYYAVDDCYEALMAEFSLTSRRAAKRFMYKLMFGTIYGQKHKVFCNRFPEAGKKLTEWKTRIDDNNPRSYKYTREGKRKNNFHSNVAFKLQNREVKYMQMIWSKLGRENIPFVTIHDAVLVPTRYADIAESLITRYLDMWFKGKAKVRRTDLTAIKKAA